MRGKKIPPEGPVNDLLLAHSLLTRLPVPEPVWPQATSSARAAWAYPLAGLTVGLIAVLFGTVLIYLGLPDAVTAAFVIAALIITTGAMHEDGLADCADGFWGGWDPGRRLEIMKDSRIGAYGVIALILSLLIRWTALTAMVDEGWLVAVIPAAMLSRAAVVGVMSSTAHAREVGLSVATGRPNKIQFLWAIGVAVIVSLPVLGAATLAALIAVAVAAMGCRALAKSKIGGQTGDVLGGIQQIAEIAVLVTLLGVT